MATFKVSPTAFLNFISYTSIVRCPVYPRFACLHKQPVPEASKCQSCFCIVGLYMYINATNNGPEQSPLVFTYVSNLNNCHLHYTNQIFLCLFIESCAFHSSYTWVRRKPDYNEEGGGKEKKDPFKRKEPPAGPGSGRSAICRHWLGVVRGEQREQRREQTHNRQ